MALRAFKLPQDFSALIEVLPPAFQYPENPEWSLQTDEMESMVDSYKSIRKIWPLLAVLQRLSPPMRDIFRGYVWEEEGKVVGLSNIMRQGTTDRWYIGNVSVLPDYRGHGYARKLVQACVDLAKERAGKSIILDVVDGNTPAYSLYEKLGFVCFSGQAELSYQSDTPLTDPALPAGYTIEKTTRFDWRPRYELALRITPDEVKHYSPVEEGRYRPPMALRPIIPIIQVATGTINERFLMREASSGQVVAEAGYSARKRKGGVNEMGLTVDPAHPALAPYLVKHLLYQIQQVSPGRRIHLMIPHWQDGLIQAGLDAGFTKQLDMKTMALLLESD
jgi:GNAT superfamily N-acetyltransferase